MIGPPGVEPQRGRRTSLPGRDGQAPAPLGAPTLEHNTPVLGMHPDEKPVGAPAMSAIRLIRTLHWTPERVVLDPEETQIVAEGAKAVNVPIACAIHGIVGSDGLW
jgi:hypothetical protein